MQFRDMLARIRARIGGNVEAIVTLKRLNLELSFRLTVSKLRAEGWKDWHMLSAIFHVAMNYRLNHILRTQGREAHAEASRRLRDEPERKDSLPVPLQEFEENNLRQQFQISMIAFAKTCKLQLHQPTPDFSAIEDFLANRYNLWAEDVEHADPFAL